MLPSFKIQNQIDIAQSNVPVSMGQVFKRGDFPSGRGLLAGASDGTYLPVQVDVRNVYPDGSVKFAVLSLIVPAIGGKGTRTYRLLDADKRSSSAAFSGVNAQVNITEAGSVYRAVISPGSAAKRTMLAGPIVNEPFYMTPVVSDAGVTHPHLVARWSIRDYAGAGKEVDVTVENCWAYAPGPQNHSFDVEVLIEGKSVYTETVTQYTQARFHKIFWSGASPQVTVLPDMAYLISTGAVPNYDQTVTPSEASLDRDAQNALNSKPMQTGAGSSYFPMTGANDEIAILPKWQADYILSGDQRARLCTMVSGDGAGSYPIHYRDQDTDRPISLSKYPYLTAVGNPSDTWNPATNKRENFPFVDHGSDPQNPTNTNPFTVDMAHQPSLAYVPYLIEGRLFHLEEMQFWAMYNSFRDNPAYREQGKGLVVSGELRAQAWGMRNVAQAAAFTPDDDELKPDLMALVNNNIAWYDANYTNNPAANSLGIFSHGASVTEDNYTKIKPWMHDFFVQSIGHSVDIGFDNAIPLLKWVSKFTVGRMTAPGLCWTLGAPYELKVRDRQDSPIYGTLLECYVNELGADMLALPCAGPEMAAAWNAQVNDMGGISNGTQGYPSYMQPALARAVDFKVPDGERAWDLHQSRVVKPDYRDGGQYNVLPISYVAKQIGPTYVPPTSGWLGVAKEGATVTLNEPTAVRYGTQSKYVQETVSGTFVVGNAFFKSDPAPNQVKMLQQYIPPTQGTDMTFKITIDGFDSAVQTLAAGSEASLTSIRIRIMSPDSATVLGESATLPYSLGGLGAGVYPLEIAALDSTGAVMGKPATGSIDTATAPVVVPPAPTTVDVSLPSSIRASVAQEQ